MFTSNNHYLGIEWKGRQIVKEQRRGHRVHFDCQFFPGACIVFCFLSLSGSVIMYVAVTVDRKLGTEIMIALQQQRNIKGVISGSSGGENKCKISLNYCCIFRSRYLPTTPL